MGRPRPAVGGSHSHSLDSVPSPGLGQRKYLCAGVPKGAYSVGLLGAKTEIPVQSSFPTRQSLGATPAICPDWERIDPNYKEIHNAKRPTQYCRRPSRESREITPRRCRAPWQGRSRSRAPTFRRSAGAFKERAPAFPGRTRQIHPRCQEVAELPL